MLQPRDQRLRLPLRQRRGRHFGARPNVMGQGPDGDVAAQRSRVTLESPIVTDASELLLQAIVLLQRVRVGERQWRSEVSVDLSYREGPLHEADALHR